MGKGNEQGLTQVQDSLLALAREHLDGAASSIVEEFLYSDAVAALLYRARLEAVASSTRGPSTTVDVSDVQLLRNIACSIGFLRNADAGHRISAQGQLEREYGPALGKLIQRIERDLKAAGDAEADSWGVGIAPSCVQSARGRTAGARCMREDDCRSPADCDAADNCLRIGEKKDG